jgi:hypothetical protein
MLINKYCPVEDQFSRKMKQNTSSLFIIYDFLNLNLCKISGDGGPLVVLAL